MYAVQYLYLAVCNNLGRAAYWLIANNVIIKGNNGGVAPAVLRTILDYSSLWGSYRFRLNAMVLVVNSLLPIPEKVGIGIGTRLVVNTYMC